MFSELLRLTAEQGTARSEDLARALDTNPELLRQALAELVRRDYLQALVPGCSIACERCPLRAACAYRRQPRIWSLTRKGQAWLEAH